MRPLPSSFFHRPTVTVARELVGCSLARMADGKVTRHLITETEAYDGSEDLASHSSKGRTARTEVMFGPGGHIYVYLIYGMHWMLNIVTGDRDYPAAVLIRGVEGANGPGKLTKLLKIDKSLNGKMLSKASGLWIEGRREKIPASKIRASKRIGIDYAGPIWAEKEWRFTLED